MFLCVGGSQTAAAYSIVGRTKVVNARSLADWGQVSMFLLKKAKVLFAFLVMASTWVFPERFLEMLRPRYFVDSTCWSSDCTQLQEDLDNLIKWEQQWQMQFNPDKCEVLTITKKRKPLLHDYNIHGHILQHVESTKYLGLNISKNLSGNTHVDAITKKANKLSRSSWSWVQSEVERTFLYMRQSSAKRRF
jgi:hypothetical protein